MLPETQIMGIVNVTPDSFSGDSGVSMPSSKKVLKEIYAQVEAGADIVDIGAESTRPGATIIDDTEEWRRLQPVFQALKADMLTGTITISLDSYHPKTVAKALAYGVSVINDVNGLKDVEMCRVLAGAECNIISMHSLSVPANKQHVLPADTNMSQLLECWMSEQYQAFETHRIARNRVCFDAGIGFGKTASQSFALMDEVMRRNHETERWVAGHSRKSCLTILDDVEAGDRDALTRALSAQFMARGIYGIRVHDVAGHVALKKALA